MISREDVFRRTGRFWNDLRASIADGVRDYMTGFDRLSFDRLDPRVEGGDTLDFALGRALAQIWRISENADPMDVCVYAGQLNGEDLALREIGLDEWPSFVQIHMVADSPATLTSELSITRRLRLDDGAEALEGVFGVSKLPGDLVMIEGLLSNSGELVMAKVAELAGAEAQGAAIVLLYQENAGPVDIGDAGGPMRNGFHPTLAATNALSHSHLSASYLRLLNLDEKENWYDEKFRRQVMDGLVAGGQARGVEITKRGFLDAMAEASPLRRVLPTHLTRFFPEAERLFWCLQEGVYPHIDSIAWDESSPVERLSLLTEIKMQS